MPSGETCNMDITNVFWIVFVFTKIYLFSQFSEIKLVKIYITFKKKDLYKGFKKFYIISISATAL